MKKNINIRIYPLTLSLMGMLTIPSSPLRAMSHIRPLMTLVADSLADDEDEPIDTTTKTRQNLATEFNALKYIMEKRYRGYNDQFTRRWDDHLFLEFGAGVHQDVGYDSKNLSPLTTAHVSLGKQFSKFHTARLTFGAGFGYYEGSKTTYSRLAASADWIFSLSNYINGYRPSRLLDVSTVLGFGFRYNTTKGTFAKRDSKEIHAGLQMRFFTGPQGYLTVEPYAGISSRAFERKYGAFYGANLSMIYYIHNNLSIEDRMRYMKRRALSVDSIIKPSAWRTPMFAEVSGGVALFKGGSGEGKTKPGHTTTISVGRWFSPVIGLRLNASYTTTTWQQVAQEMGETDIDKRAEQNISEQPTHNYNQHNINADASAEALINPLGFLPNFSWDSPFGFSIVLGGGIGWLDKEQRERLRTVSTFYTGGLHLWYRLSDDLQFFIEPRYTNYNYKIPYSNISKVKRFSDDMFTVHVGLTAYTRGISFRKQSPKYIPSAIPVSVGVGGGTSLLFTRNSYEGSSMNTNFNVFAEYHFDKVSSARVAFEYMSLHGMAPMRYKALDVEGMGYSTSGMFKHDYTRGFLSLNYLVNVTNLCSGYQGRRLFEAEAFVGPTLMFAMSNSHEPDASIRLNEGYTLQPQPYNDYTKPLLGANAGVKLKLNVMSHLAVTLTPQFHLLRLNPRMTGIEMVKFRGFETLDLGVQYDF